MTKILTYVIITILAGTLGVWIGDREPPTAIISARALGPVAPGEVARIEYRVHRYRSCPYRIDRVLLDADGVRLPLADQDFAAAPGPLGDDTYIALVPIPRIVAQGVVRYRSILSYTCNAVHRLFAPVVVASAEVAIMVRGAPTPAQMMIELVPTPP